MASPPDGACGAASGWFSVSTTREILPLLKRTKSFSKALHFDVYPWLTTDTTNDP